MKKAITRLTKTMVKTWFEALAVCDHVQQAAPKELSFTNEIGVGFYARL